MSVTKPSYLDNFTGLPSISFTSKSRIVVCAFACAIFALHKIPTELSEKQLYFTKLKFKHRPLEQTSSCLLKWRSICCLSPFEDDYWITSSSLYCTMHRQPKNKSYINNKTHGKGTTHTQSHSSLKLRNGMDSTTRTGNESCIIFFVFCFFFFCFGQWTGIQHV